MVAGQTSTVQVHLEPGATVRGVAQDAHGAPVARAGIRVGNWSDVMTLSQVWSDGDGNFEFTDLPAGEVEILASHDSAGRASLRVVASHEVVTTCALRLTRGVVMRGRVLTEDGAAVTDARVTASWSGGLGLADVDDEGRFEIDGCAADEVSVRVEGPGIERLLKTGVDPYLPVELRVRPVPEPSARLSGMVVDLLGRPLGDASVFVGREGQSVTERLHVVTAADGRFSFGPLRPGRWYLEVNVPDSPRFEHGPIELEAHARHDHGSIRIGSGGTLRAKLSGSDPSGVQFRARSLDGGASAEMQLGAGELTSPLLTAGKYELLVFGNGVAEQTVPFVVRAAEETRIDLSLERGVRQGIEIRLPSGFAPGDAIELAVRRGEESVRRRTLRPSADAKARMEIWLTPGRYSAAASFGPRRAEESFTVGSEEGTAVLLVVE